MNCWWKDWSEFTFGIWLKFVSLGSQVNGQVWYFKQWILWLPEFWSILFTVLVDNSSCKDQVSVKPSVPETSSVSWYMELFHGFELSFWNWCNSQAWAVSMGTNDLESSVFWWESLSNVEGDQSGVVSGEEVLGTFFELPIGCLAQLFVSFCSEFISTPVDDVEGWAGLVDKVQESLG